MCGRCNEQVLGSLPPVFALLVITAGGRTLPAGVVSAVLTVGLGLNSATHSGFYAMLIDLSPQHAGVLCGISNTIGTIPGMVGNQLTGASLRCRTW